MLTALLSDYEFFLQKAEQDIPKIDNMLAVVVGKTGNSRSHPNFQLEWSSGPAPD